jgi:uncharacterized membrane protein YqaE (UPF0057 family)
MSIWRALFCIILPPLAVYDKGLGAVLLTFILWSAGWVPGSITAIIFATRGK